MSTLVSQAVSQAAATLASAGVASPLFDAQSLAAFVLGCDRMSLVLRGSNEMPEAFFELVERRASREPLQHIVGTAPMGKLDLEVGPGVFVPRPETELLGQWAVEKLLLAANPVAVDLCTGSGALALYVATEAPNVEVTAVEIDPKAAEWARKNVEKLAPQVKLVMGDATDSSLLPELHGRCDLVVSNPPYVPEATVVDAEVLVDPHHAVFGGDSGMDVIVPMVSLMKRLLKLGGWLGIEHDDSTAQHVMDAVELEGGFTDIESHQDFAGRDRFVTARLQ